MMLLEPERKRQHGDEEDAPADAEEPYRIAGALATFLCAIRTIPHAARRETARLRDSDPGGGLSKLLFANRG